MYLKSKNGIVDCSVYVGAGIKITPNVLGDDGKLFTEYAVYLFDKELNRYYFFIARSLEKAQKAMKAYQKALLSGKKIFDCDKIKAR